MTKMYKPFDVPYELALCEGFFLNFTVYSIICYITDARLKVGTRAPKLSRWDQVTNRTKKFSESLNNLICSIGIIVLSFIQVRIFVTDYFVPVVYKSVFGCACTWTSKHLQRIPCACTYTTVERLSNFELYFKIELI